MDIHFPTMQITSPITSAGMADPWVQEMHAALRSAADFVIAQISHAPDVIEIAGRVLCAPEGRFISVATIEKQCCSHGWNSMIYEAWLWERRNQVLDTAKKLTSYEREALLLYAESQESLNISHTDAYAAINEAWRDLYGDQNDFDDGCDIDLDDTEELDFSDVE